MPSSDRAATIVARLPGLDVLRALAVAWTMLYHASLFGLVLEEPWPVAFGWMGVDLFFVLSGYLIAGQLLRAMHAGSADYAGFMQRRLFRTLPAYLVVVALYFAFPGVREREQIQPLWQFLTFTQNFGLVPPKAFSHAWSLCVEEQFYLVAPLALALLARTSRVSAAAWTAVAIVAAGILVRTYLWLAEVAVTPFDAAADPASRPYMMLIYYPTWSRLDGLLAGVVAAAIELHRPREWAVLRARPNALLLLACAGVALAMYTFGGQIAKLPGAALGYPLLAASLALAVVAATDSRCVLARLNFAIVSAVAAASYSLYLVHKAVFRLVAEGMAGSPQPFVLAAALAASCVVGAALYLLVERPCLRLRSKWFAARGGTGGTGHRPSG